MGGKSFKSKKIKMKPGVGRGEKKVAPKKKQRSGEKKNWEEGREKQSCKNEVRAEKGQRRKVNLGWHRDRKENPITAPSIHVGALVGAGSLWPLEKLFSTMDLDSDYYSSRCKDIVVFECLKGLL